MALSKRIGIVILSFIGAMGFGLGCLAVGVRLQPRAELLFWLPVVLSLPLFLAAMILSTRGIRAWVRVVLSITGTLFLEGLFIIAFPLWGYAVVSHVPGR